MVALDEAQRLARAVDLVVQLRIGGGSAALALEVVQPGQCCTDEVRRMHFHLIDCARCGQCIRWIHVHSQNLPISLALIDKANCPERSAHPDHANIEGTLTENNYVQWIVVAT